VHNSDYAITLSMSHAHLLPNVTHVFGFVLAAAPVTAQKVF
jgi:hypothetical protein